LKNDIIEIDSINSSFTVLENSPIPPEKENISITVHELDNNVTELKKELEKETEIVLETETEKIDH
jgi:hypothetical protein